MLTSITKTPPPDYFHWSGYFYYLLADLQGNCLYINPHFQQRFSHLFINSSGKRIADFFIAEDRARYQEAVSKCVQHAGTIIQVELHIQLPDHSTCITKWEVSSIVNEENKIDQLQLIGVAADTVATKAADLENGSAKLPERYKAYEESTEGLWMFESKQPVPIDSSPEVIIESLKKDAYLAECNDNVARMYGYEKGEELVGASLESLMDFSDPVYIENLRKFIRNKFQSTGLETKEFDRYGNTKYFLNRMTGIVENGMLKRVWGTQQDITEQRSVEQQIQQSELFYRSLIADSLDGVLLTDEKGIISFASHSIASILGYEPDEVIGQSVFSFAYQDDHQLAVSAFEDEVKKQPKVKFINIRLCKKSGEPVWCIIKGHNLMDNPYVGRMVIYFYDDSLRKEAEEALMESQHRFREQAVILNNVTDVIVTTDLDRKVTSWNKVTERLTGITEEETVGKPYRDVLNTDYSPFTQEQIADIIFANGVWRGEISFLGSNEERKYLLHTISLIQNEEGKNIGLLGVGKDITERKKIEAMLQESETFYRNLIFHSLDGIVMTDLNGMITYCAPSVTNISGYEPQHLLSHSIYEFVHPDDLELARSSFFAEVTKQTTPHDYVAVRLKHSDGDWVWCTVRGHNLLNNPAFNAVVIYFTDDSRRKETESKLKESEEQFRHLLNNLPTGVILLDSSFKMLMCNRAAYLELGLSEEEILSQSVFDLNGDYIHEDGSIFQIDDYPVVQSLKTKKIVSDVVMGIYNPAINDRVWLLVNAEPIFEKNGEVQHVICSFINITEQKRLSQKLIEQEINKQKQLTQATIDGQEKERVEIGKELHDNINQHLTTTRLYLEVAKEKATGEVHEMIHFAHKNLVGIINEIRNLSQSLVPPTLGDLGLIESISDLCDSLKRTHTFKIEFLHRHFNENVLPDNLKLMLFRIIQEQVSNIVKHANATNVLIRLQSDAEYIILTVIDDGQGFDTSDFKKGLGLSNIGNRAGLFNGKVEVEAEPGKGCTLTVVIPLNLSLNTVI